MPKPPVGGLDTPNVRPTDGLMPGLLKLKPELLVLPKPSKRKRRNGKRSNTRKHKYRQLEGSSDACIKHYVILVKNPSTLTVCRSVSLCINLLIKETFYLL